MVKVIFINYGIPSFSNQRITKLVVFIERIVVVTEYNGDPLSSKENLGTDDIIKIAFQCLLGLHCMNTLDLVHRHLSPDNVLINKSGNVQLYNFGLYYMTDSGKNVCFPIGYV